MIDGLVTETPVFQRLVDRIFIGENQGARLNSLFENRLDSFLLNIRQQMENYLATALDHPQDRRFFASQRAAPTLAFQPSAASETAQAPHYFRMAFVSSDDVDFITFNLTA